jgi:hypothetical protein
MRLRPIVAGMREPYRYEREVEEFLRWSPHVKNPNFRKESHLSADELVELQKLLTTYGDASTAAGNSSDRAAQAEAVARAARASADEDAGASAIPAPEPNGGRSAATDAPRSDAPVEHYDDLGADEIVSLLDSLEDADLRALRVYETDAGARPRVLAAIDAVVARRTSGPVA